MEKNKKEDTSKESDKYEFKMDFPVGLKKDGSPKKVYLKGKSYVLKSGIADYLKDKNVIK